MTSNFTMILNMTPKVRVTKEKKINWISLILKHTIKKVKRQFTVQGHLCANYISNEALIYKELL